MARKIVIANDSIICNFFRSWNQSTDDATDNDLGKWHELRWNVLAAFFVFIKVTEINLKFRC